MIPFRNLIHMFFPYNNQLLQIFFTDGLPKNLHSQADIWSEISENRRPLLAFYYPSLIM